MPLQPGPFGPSPVPSTSALREPPGVHSVERSPVPVTVATLLRTPALELTLHTGSAATDRPLSWVHVSELADPTPFLEGGELLLTTGLALPEDDEGIREYVLRLAEAGVAALGLGTGLGIPAGAGRPRGRGGRARDGRARGSAADAVHRALADGRQRPRRGGVRGGGPDVGGPAGADACGGRPRSTGDRPGPAGQAPRRLGPADRRGGHAAGGGPTGRARSRRGSGDGGGPAARRASAGRRRAHPARRDRAAAVARHGGAHPGFPRRRATGAVPAGRPARRQRRRAAADPATRAVPRPRQRHRRAAHRPPATPAGRRGGRRGAGRRRTGRPAPGRTDPGPRRPRQCRAACGRRRRGRRRRGARARAGVLGRARCVARRARRRRHRPRRPAGPAARSGSGATVGTAPPVAWSELAEGVRHARQAAEHGRSAGDR